MRKSQQFFSKASAAIPMVQTPYRQALQIKHVTIHCIIPVVAHVLVIAPAHAAYKWSAIRSRLRGTLLSAVVVVSTALELRSKRWNDDGSLETGSISGPNPIISADDAGKQEKDFCAAAPRPPASMNEAHLRCLLHTASFIVGDSVFCSLIASTVRTSRSCIHDSLGPLVDSGAHYSAIAMDDLHALATSILPTWSSCLIPLPATVADHRF